MKVHVFYKKQHICKYDITFLLIDALAHSSAQYIEVADCIDFISSVALC